MALAPHDFTALAPHDYTAPAPHDCTAPAPPPRARYANDSEFKFGPGYPKIAKFLVPVDGSQQNSVRSSPAGTHRTFFWIHFQNPVSPTSISQNAAARAQLLSLNTSSAFQCQPSLFLHCSCFPTDFPCGHLARKRKPLRIILLNKSNHCSRNPRRFSCRSSIGNIHSIRFLRG